MDAAHSRFCVMHIYNKMGPFKRSHFIVDTSLLGTGKARMRDMVLLAFEGDVSWQLSDSVNSESIMKIEA